MTARSVTYTLRANTVGGPGLQAFEQALTRIQTAQNRIRTQGATVIRLQVLAAPAIQAANDAAAALRKLPASVTTTVNLRVNGLAGAQNDINTLKTLLGSVGTNMQYRVTVNTTALAAVNTQILTQITQLQSLITQLRALGGGGPGPRPPGPGGAGSISAATRQMLSEMEALNNQYRRGEIDAGAYGTALTALQARLRTAAASATAGTADFAALDRSLTRLTGSLRGINTDAFQKLRLEATQMRAAFDTATAGVARNSAQFQASAAAYAAASASVTARLQAMASSGVLTTSQLRQVNSELARLAREQATISGHVNAGGLSGNILNVLSQMGGPFGLVAGQAAQFGGAIRGAATALGPFGVAIGVTTVAVGLLAAGIGVAVNEYAKFEQQMQAVKAVSDAQGGSFDKLKVQVKDLAMEYGANVVEVGKVQEELFKAGRSVDDVMGGAAKAVLVLMQATGSDLSNAVRIAGASMNTFGIAGKDMMRVADAIANGANKTALDVNTLGMALQQVGNSASSADLSLEETVAVLGLMADRGIQGSDAGTSLKVMLQRLTSGMPDVISSLDRYNIKVYDGAGAQRDMIVVLGEVLGAMDKMTDQERGAFLAKVAGSDAQRVLTASYKAGTTSLQDYIALMDDHGRAEKDAKTRAEGLIGAQNRLNTAFQVFKTSVGEYFAPAITELVESASRGVKELNSLFDWLRKLQAERAGVQKTEIQNEADTARKELENARRDLRDLRKIANPSQAGLNRIAAKENEIAVLEERLRTLSANVKREQQEAVDAGRAAAIKNGTYIGPQMGNTPSYIQPLTTQLGVNAYAVSQEFGSNPNRLGYGGRGHQGVDVAAPMGTAIKAAFDATVYTGFDKNGYGRYVKLIDEKGQALILAHLDSLDAALADDLKKYGAAKVKAGTLLGRTGTTGNSTGPHLHMEGRTTDNLAVDPRTLVFDGTPAAEKPETPARKAPATSDAALLGEARRILTAIARAEKDNKVAASVAAEAVLKAFTDSSPAAAKAVALVRDEIKDTATEVGKFGQGYDRLKKQLGSAESLFKLSENTPAYIKSLEDISAASQKAADVEKARFGMSDKYNALTTLAGDATAKARQLRESEARERTRLASEQAQHERDAATLTKQLNADLAAGQIEQARALVSQLEQNRQVRLALVKNDAAKRLEVEKTAGQVILAANKRVLEAQLAQDVQAAHDTATQRRAALTTQYGAGKEPAGDLARINKAETDKIATLRATYATEVSKAYGAAAERVNSAQTDADTKQTELARISVGKQVASQVAMTNAVLKALADRDATLTEAARRSAGNMAAWQKSIVEGWEKDQLATQKSLALTSMTTLDMAAFTTAMSAKRLQEQKDYYQSLKPGLFDQTGGMNGPDSQNMVMPGVKPFDLNSSAGQAYLSNEQTEAARKLREEIARLTDAELESGKTAALAADDGARLTAIYTEQRTRVDAAAQAQRDYYQSLKPGLFDQAGGTNSPDNQNMTLPGQPAFDMESAAGQVFLTHQQEEAARKLKEEVAGLTDEQLRAGTASVDASTDAARLAAMYAELKTRTDDAAQAQRDYYQTLQAGTFDAVGGINMPDSQNMLLPGVKPWTAEDAQHADDVTQAQATLASVTRDLGQAAGDTVIPWTEQITTLEELKKKYPELGAQIDQLIAKLHEMQKVSAQQTGLDRLKHNVEQVGQVISGVLSMFGQEQMAQGVQELASAVTGGVEAFGKFASGDILGGTVAAIGALGNLGKAIDNLNPAIKRQKKEWAELAAAEQQAMGSRMVGGSNGMNGFFNPYYDALKADSEALTQKVNAGFWQRLGWSLFGGAPETLDKSASESLQRASAVFNDFASSLYSSLENELMNGIDSGDLSKASANMGKLLDRFVQRMYVQALIAKSRLGDLAKQLADEVAAGKDTTSTRAQIKAETDNVITQAEAGAPSQPGYGAGADTSSAAPGSSPAGDPVVGSTFYVANSSKIDLFDNVIQRADAMYLRHEGVLTLHSAAMTAHAAALDRSTAMYDRLVRDGITLRDSGGNYAGAMR